MVWYREQIDLINQYVVFPWGMALCLLRLERRKAAAWPAPRRDVQVLFVLLLWIIAPFMLRFGVTFNNMGALPRHRQQFPAQIFRLLRCPPGKGGIQMKISAVQNSHRLSPPFLPACTDRFAYQW